MNSIWGHFGAVCERFGWTVDYILWGITWVNLQMIIADSAKIISNQKEDKEETNVSTAEDYKNLIDKLNMR